MAHSVSQSVSQFIRDIVKHRPRWSYSQTDTEPTAVLPDSPAHSLARGLWFLDIDYRYLYRHLYVSWILIS
jgi:hypothetical protein